MAVAKESSKVKILLEGKLEDGTVFGKTEKDKPVEFIVGEGRMLPKIENAVKGMKTGEKKSIKLEPEDAFGPRREDLVMDIPRHAITLDKEPKVGATLLVKSPEGRTFSATIVRVGKETLRIDFNYPLAGKNVIINIELLSVE
ncbi:FKBP-type peptidyl-prolyl cis-trans isomerase [Candidatus Bathyarchaeota archaeon]|nr:FKBP-type peptidyl-prolyl cis-trans isomerase [Candidatus Bathyarchaeota archaeon]